MILQDAQCSFVQGENWKFVTPQGAVIAEVKGDYNEREIMQFLRVFRKLELEAYNEGKDSERHHRSSEIMLLVDRNEVLSTALEKELNRE